MIIFHKTADNIIILMCRYNCELHVSGNCMNYLFVVIKNLFMVLNLDRLPFVANSSEVCEDYFAGRRGVCRSQSHDFPSPVIPPFLTCHQQLELAYCFLCLTIYSSHQHFIITFQKLCVLLNLCKGIVLLFCVVVRIYII